MNPNRLALRCLVAVASVLASYTVVGAAFGQARSPNPSFQVLRGLPIGPADASSYYNSQAATHTDGLCRDYSSINDICPGSGRPRDVEVRELARALKYDPDLIYEYVRNSIDTEFIFGLHKGSLGVVLDRSAGAFDQAKLLSDLMREAGYTARIRYGDISLSGAQFSDWTGVTDAQAGCSLLAAGGIPAVINGSISCASAPTPISNVVMAHAWVEVDISGSTYQFDPSFKPYLHKTGIDLRTPMGFSAGAAQSAAQGTPTGAAFEATSNFASESLDSLLAAYANNIRPTLASVAAAGGAMSDVVGGDELVPAQRPIGGWRQSSLGYVSTIRGTWADAPDVFRANVSVTCTGTLAGRFFLDEIYGRRLDLQSVFPSSSSTLYTDLLILDNVKLTGHSAVDCQDIILAIDHPFAANQGTYADSSIEQRLNTAQSISVVFGTGQGSQARRGRLAKEFTADRQNMKSQGAYYSTSGDLKRDLFAAEWLYQFGSAAKIHANIAKSLVSHLHTIGLVYATGNTSSDVITIGAAPTEAVVTDLSDVVDLSSGVAITSKYSDAVARRGVAFALAATGASLEGSVGNEFTESPDISSVSSRFHWGNRPEAGETLSTSPRPFLHVASGATPPSASMFYSDGAPFGPGSYNLFRGGAFQNAAAAAWASYASAGFDLVGSVESLLGPGSLLGSPVPCTGDDTGTCYGPGAPVLRGAAFLAVNYDPASAADPIAIAHVVTDNFTSAKGGGASNGQTDPRTLTELLKDKFSDRSVILGTDLSSGNVEFQSPVLNSVGRGSFPYRLEERIELRGGGLYANNPDACLNQPTCFTDLARARTGPVSNFDGEAVVGSSGAEAMGRSRVDSTAETVAAFITLQDVWTADRSLRRDVVGELVADWWTRQTRFNTTTLSEGAGATQFVKVSPGFFRGLTGASSVTMTGSPRVYRPKYLDPTLQYGGTLFNSGASSRIYEWANVGLSANDGHGVVRHYEYWESPYIFLAPGQGLPDTASLDRAYFHGFRLKSWSYPQGVSAQLTYSNLSGVPSSVQNSLGRSLTLSSVPGQTILNTASCYTWLVDRNTWSEQPAGSWNVVSFSDAGGGIYKLTFLPTVGRSISNRPDDTCRLQSVHFPADQTNAYFKYDYNSMGQLSHVWDATAVAQSSRGPYSFLFADGYRSERDDPAGGAYALENMTSGGVMAGSAQSARLKRTIDEVGRVTVTLLDGRGRVLSRKYPESDQELFSYDVNDNVTQLTKVSKDGGTQLSVAATYDPSWNEVASVTDAMGNTTSFTYFGSGSGASLIRDATRPADANGNHPFYSWQYNSVGLVTQEINPTGVTTTHSYDAQGNLSSTTTAAAVANGQPALNLTTNYLYYNAAGDPYATFDPRNNIYITSFDAMRRLSCDARQTGGTTTFDALTCRAYDLNGRIYWEGRATAVDSNYNAVSWQPWLTSYSPTGKVITKTDPLGHITTITYDNVDRTQTVTDPTGRMTKFLYDLAGEKTQERRAVGTALEQAYVSYTYTPNGKVYQETDARGNTITTTYDGLDRLFRTTFPAVVDQGSNNVGSTYEQYDYDPSGNVTIWTNREGYQLIRCYDALGRKVAERGVTGASNQTVSMGGATGSCPQGGTANTSSRWFDVADRSYSYDLAGRMLTADSANGWYYHLSYDADGRPITVNNNFGAIGYGYDAAGNNTHISYPSGDSLAYEYDGLNRMATATLNGTRVATLAWDARSRRKSLTYGDGSAVSYTYDEADRLVASTHHFPNGASADLTSGFGYDDAGRINSRTDSNDAYTATPNTASVNYGTADALNRYDTIAGQSKTYYNTGALNGDFDSLPADQRGRAYETTGAFKFGYALNNGDNWSYQDTDALGNISQTQHRDPVSGTDTYHPRAFGLRPEALMENTYTWPHSNPNAPWTYQGYQIYVLGPNPDERLAFRDTNGTVYYPHADRQGSTIALATAGQNVLTRTYGPYGEPYAPHDSSGTQSILGVAPGAVSYQYLYTGQRYDDFMKAYDYKARMYSPIDGRFLQPDPIGTADQENLYGYVSNDPLDQADPSGNCPSCVGAIIGGGIELAFQLSDPHERAAYSQAFTSLQHGDLGGAWHSAGNQVLRVGISAGAGAVGVVGSARVAAYAARVAAPMASKAAVELGVKLAGNAAVGSATGAGSQSAKNHFAGDHGSVRGAALTGGVFGTAATAGTELTAMAAKGKQAVVGAADIVGQIIGGAAANRTDDARNKYLDRLRDH